MTRPNLVDLNRADTPPQYRCAGCHVLVRKHPDGWWVDGAGQAYCWHGRLAHRGVEEA